MNLQFIKSVKGQVEYVLLPINIYKALKPQIIKKLKEQHDEDDYVPFVLADYIGDCPIALARIEACVSQKELAKRMGVSQAYISKIEKQSNVSAKLLKKVKDALTDKKK